MADLLSSVAGYVVLLTISDAPRSSTDDQMNKRTAVNDARDMPRVDELVPRTKPDWGKPENADKMKATWMGHASYLVEMPRDGPAPTSEKSTKDEGRGVTILFDPAWSKRCSPVQFAGSIRYQGKPLPERRSNN